MHVEVRQAEFEPLDSIFLIDPEKLRTRNRRIEIGSVEAGCCRKRVFAVIRKGKVTKIDVEPCEKGRDVSAKQFRGLIKEAYRRSRRTPPKPWKPIPVREVFASQQIMSGC